MKFTRLCRDLGYLPLKPTGPATLPVNPESAEKFRPASRRTPHSSACPFPSGAPLTSTEVDIIFLKSIQEAQEEPVSRVCRHHMSLPAFRKAVIMLSKQTFSALAGFEPPTQPESPEALSLSFEKVIKPGMENLVRNEAELARHGQENISSLASADAVMTIMSEMGMVELLVSSQDGVRRVYDFYGDVVRGTKFLLWEGFENMLRDFGLINHLGRLPVRRIFFDAIQADISGNLRTHIDHNQMTKMALQFALALLAFRMLSDSNLPPVQRVALLLDKMNDTLIAKRLSKPGTRLFQLGAYSKLEDEEDSQELKMDPDHPDNKHKPPSWQDLER